VQELHQVKAADQGVSQIDERPREALVHDRCHAARVALCATRRYCRNIAVTVTGQEDQGSVPAAESKRSRRATTSLATSPMAVLPANACARSRASASSRLTPSCTEIIPVAW
jgi:hypothetical protein